MADRAMRLAAAHAPGLSTFVTSTREIAIPAILQPLEISCPSCAERSKRAVECPTAAVGDYSADSVERRPMRTTAATTTTITAATTVVTTNLTDTATARVMVMATAAATVMAPL